MSETAPFAEFPRRIRSGDARAAEELVHGAAECAAVEPGPEQVAAGRDLLEALPARLTAEERAVADRRGAGQGWAEIAAALGGTADGRRMQLKRALDRVAPALGLEDDEEGSADV